MLGPDLASEDKDQTVVMKSTPTQSSAIGVITYNGLITGNPNLDAKIILLSLLARYEVS